MYTPLRSLTSDIPSVPEIGRFVLGSENLTDPTALRRTRRGYVILVARYYFAAGLDNC
jgi:hypothetical protein